MERFYQTMHSTNKTNYEDLDRVLCRLTHNVNKTTKNININMHFGFFSSFFQIN